MFKDRLDAAEKLAEKLKGEISPSAAKQMIILGIPRGGVVIGVAIARKLQVPYDSLVTKKIPAPESEEVVIGALAEGGVVVWEDGLCRQLAVPVDYKTQIVKEKLGEMEAKEGFYRQGRPVPELLNRTVVIVDDGVATGATMKAAVAAVREYQPKEIVVAAPVVAPDSLTDLQARAERVIYLEVPEMFFSLDQFYQDFRLPTDEELERLLSEIYHSSLGAVRLATGLS